MGPSASSSYKHIFEELEEWLQSEKAIADLLFILDFCKAWWDPAMLWWDRRAG